MRKWISPLLALGLAALFGSCLRQEDFNRDMFADAGITYDVAIPLTHTKLTMANLIDLKGGLFVPDDTSLLHIIYSIDPVRENLIGDVALEQASPFALSVSGIPYMGRKDTLITVPFTDTLRFNLNGVNARVKTLYFSSVQLVMRSQNGFLHPLDVEMRYENIRDQNGQPFVFRHQALAESQEDTIVNLADIRIELDEIDEIEEPFIVLSGTAKVNVRRIEGDSNIYKGSIYISSNFREMDCLRVDGYFETTSYQIKATMPIVGLGLERMKNIDFDNARIIADLKVNGVSAPLRFIKSNVLIHNVEGAPVEIPLFPENYNVAIPDITDNPLEKDSRESIEIGNMLIDRPELVTYVLDGMLNPDNDNTRLQALQKEGFLAVGLTCDVPLHFSADRYALCDTLEVSLDDLDENTELRYFDVKSIVKNAFPLDVMFSLHFLDANQNRLFSLFHDDLIAGGKIGPAPGLHVVDPTVVKFEDVLDLHEMELARQMHYVVVDAKISTTDQQKVKVYVDGEKEGFVDAKVGVRIKIKQKGLLDF